MTRGKKISKQDIQTFICGLDCIPEKDKQELLKLTPATYVGLAKKIVDAEIKKIL